MGSESLFLGILLVAVCVFAAKPPRLLRSKAPMQTAAAEVLSRRGDAPTATLPSHWGGRMNYKVTFSVDGNTMELNVTSNQYARLVEGCRGQLTWQNDTMVDFIPTGEKEI